MKINTLFLGCLSGLAVAVIISPPSFAYTSTNGESVMAYVQTNQIDINNHNRLTPGPFKQIILKKITLSDEEKKQFAERIQNLHKASSGITPMTLMATPLLPASVSLGMNGVPVLDQGPYGACATFAVTALLDALYGHGDYISQLCYLQTYPAYWSGAAAGGTGLTAGLALLENLKNGVVSKSYEHNYGCGGLYQYPENGVQSGYPMTIDEYSQHSEKIFATTVVTWGEIFGEFDADYELNHVKQALANQHRVIVDIFLESTGGLYGYYKVKSDGAATSIIHRLFPSTPTPNSWVLTANIEQEIKKGEINAGHKLIITGYNDDAIIMDSDNIEHRGVLKLRNSWGSNVGDHGDFYMSYDYFKALAANVYEVSLTK